MVYSQSVFRFFAALLSIVGSTTPPKIGREPPSFPPSTGPSSEETIPSPAPSSFGIENSSPDSDSMSTSPGKTIEEPSESPPAVRRGFFPSSPSPSLAPVAEATSGDLSPSQDAVSQIVLRLSLFARQALGACLLQTTVDWQQLDAAREGLTKELTNLVKLARGHSTSNVDIDTFGSLRSGLADGRNSDLDASVTFGEDKNVSPDRAKGLAETLSEQLKLLDQPEKLFRVSRVLGAVVPLVKLEIFLENTSSEQLERSTFPIDLSFNNLTGKLNTLWLREQVQQDPFFRPLVLEVKEFAKRIGLHGTFHDHRPVGQTTTPSPVGLSSYGWSLLVAFFLHEHPALHPVFQKKSANFVQDVQETFQEFRKYYATFDYEQDIISFPGAFIQRTSTTPDATQEVYPTGPPRPVDHVVSTSRQPVARATWWQDFQNIVEQTGEHSVAQFFHFDFSYPVLLDPFDNTRNLFRYFSHPRNLEILTARVVGWSDPEKRVFGPSPQAVHVFPWKLRVERIFFDNAALLDDGCFSGEFDLELFSGKREPWGTKLGGKTVRGRAPPPLSRREREKRELWEKNVAFADPFLSLHLRAFEACNKNPFDKTEVQLMFAGKPLRNIDSIILAPQKDLFSRLTVTPTFSPVPSRRWRNVKHVVRLINGMKLIFSATSTTAILRKPVRKGAGEQVVPVNDPENIPWVVRVLSEISWMWEDSGPRANLTVWCEAVIALEAVFAKGGLGLGAGSAGAELVVDLVSKKLGMTLRQPSLEFRRKSREVGRIEFRRKSREVGRIEFQRKSREVGRIEFQRKSREVGRIEFLCRRPT